MLQYDLYVQHVYKVSGYVLPKHILWHIIRSFQTSYICPCTVVSVYDITIEYLAKFNTVNKVDCGWIIMVNYREDYNGRSPDTWQSISLFV